VLIYGTLEYELAVPPPNGTGQVDIEDADDTDVAGMVGPGDGRGFHPREMDRYDDNCGNVHEKLEG